MPAAKPPECGGCAAQVPVERGRKGEISRILSPSIARAEEVVEHARTRG